MGAREEGKKVAGAYDMKCVARDAHHPAPLLFEPSENTQTMEPTTTYAAVSSLRANIRYSFLHLSGLECTLEPRLGARSGEVSVQ